MRTAVEQRFGPYGGQRWQLVARIRELAEAETPAPEAADEPGRAEDEPGGERA